MNPNLSILSRKKIKAVSDQDEHSDRNNTDETFNPENQLKPDFVNC